MFLIPYDRKNLNALGKMILGNNNKNKQCVVVSTLHSIDDLLATFLFVSKWAILIRQTC